MIRRNTKGQFRKGSHWRPHGEHREKAWLEEQYLVKKRSAAEIAPLAGITENGILYWLHKHGIPRRSYVTPSQARLRPASPPSDSAGDTSAST